MNNRKKVPTILQMEATECGAASLAMIFAYFGKYIPLEQMRIETGVSRDGCNAKNVRKAAVKYGLEAKAFRKEPADLKKMQMPCIIHWNFNHFVVLEGFSGKNVYLNDPAVGRRKLTFEELDDSFTGVVMTFKKTDDFVKEKKKGRVVSFITNRVKDQIPVLLKLLYIGLLLVLPGLILPVLSQVFIDDVLGKGYRDWLVRVLVFMGGCLILKEGLTYYRSLILTKLKGKMTLISGYRFLSHMFGLPMSFFDQRYTGDLANRISNNDSINDFMAGDLAETALNLITAVFYLALLIFYSPVLTGIGLVSVVVSIVVAVFANKLIANATMKMQMSGGKLYGAVCAGLSITDTIKASGIENQYSNRILGHQALNASQGQELKRSQQIISAIPTTVGQLTDVLILMVGAMMAIRGEFTIGMLTAFSSLFGSFTDPVNKLVGFFEGIQTLKSNINRVDDIEKYPAEEKNTAATSTLTGAKLSGVVELSDVSFGYSILKPPTVSGFSFSLHSGETIAFVGPSGCGKSTISKVISGLYKPWSGDVYFDGKSIRDIPPNVLHASVSTVSQNIMLFSGSIKDNLTMWNDVILESDLIEAAKDACIHDFIMQQPGGYNYRLEENGANLSGGQRQRLEIARALATKPSILIMDEATSALDPVVEKQIMDNIRRRGCTCVIVAHRLSTIRDCTQIVVMKQGQIVQRGTHESMMKEENSYYRSFVMNG
ncbi:MAG: NHLP family bacteriocin export ABC transporter peptidase/permease/ATPase subunit [Clostridia bacterium]|nr:NHLP family bacteriocin export ABC transporter peptidase/permease/ATPase subunit [Clostridia bacterium]